jgi:Carboxypeptidase regulatory-like domain
MRNALFIFTAMAVSILSGCLHAENAVAEANPATASHAAVAVDAHSERFVLSGRVVAADGEPIRMAEVHLGTALARTDAQGSFQLPALTGENKISIAARGYTPLAVPVSISADTDLKFELQLSTATTVSAQVDNPISSALTQVYESDELLEARPGQPGVAVALPGYPSETASGGVKAPQYFAPGVAGDHGEPIAQYIRVGDFLFPNNLPANAHGNGYADPNLLIPNAIGFVESDAGAFDVRHGNNAVDLAVAYGLVPRLEPFVQISTDPRDYDLVSGWSPGNPQAGAWLGMEIAGGDGFLKLPEHRRQYKVNGERHYSFGHHLLTLFGAGYYGQSRIPGLVPIGVPVLQDTIDPRQSDRTHTALFVASDTWQITDRQQLQFSEYFRTYSLDLKSDFGDGLIRQSEFRTVTGGNTSYHRRVNSTISFLAGLDFRRDSPRNAELSHLDASGVFRPVTRNDFTISDLAPYASVEGSISRFLTYSAGVRHDAISFRNNDRLTPADSYETRAGLTSPRGTLSFRVPSWSHFPILTFSSGEAFHTNDPRIGLGTSHGTPIATSHANQFVATESILGTRFRLALVRVSNSQELAKIDPDTGLQQSVGPSLVRALTVSAQRHFSFASFQATFARAQAKNRLTGQDIPEAPRLIWDVSATTVRLPAQLRASGGFEYVGRKPLGDGFAAVPVREIRGSLTRNFRSDRFEAGVHFLLANSYTGQTLETLQLPNETMPSERIVGVRNQSYAGVSFTYHLRPARQN